MIHNDLIDHMNVYTTLCFTSLMIILYIILKIMQGKESVMRCMERNLHLLCNYYTCTCGLYFSLGFFRRFHLFVQTNVLKLINGLDREDFALFSWRYFYKFTQSFLCIFIDSFSSRSGYQYRVIQFARVFIRASFQVGRKCLQIFLVHSRC